MGKTIIHGVKENGLLDAEFKCTAVLVTELINNQHKMSEWEIYKALTEIREAAERDARTAHAYAAALKAKKRRATMGEQLTMISIPKGERTDLVKRRWENAFQKWSDEQALNGEHEYGACGYGVMCDWCTDNGFGRPCVRALNAMCREKGILINYGNDDYTTVWRGTGL